MVGDDIECISKLLVDIRTNERIFIILKKNSKKSVKF